MNRAFTAYKVLVITAAAVALIQAFSFLVKLAIAPACSACITL